VFICSPNIVTQDQFSLNMRVVYDIRVGDYIGLLQKYSSPTKVGRLQNLLKKLVPGDMMSGTN
jgi:hypothetical protein